MNKTKFSKWFTDWSDENCLEVPIIDIEDELRVLIGLAQEVERMKCEVKTKELQKTIIKLTMDNQSMDILKKRHMKLAEEFDDLKKKHKAEIKEAKDCVQKNHLCRKKGSTNYCIVMSTEGNILCLKPDCKNKICPLNGV